MIEFWLVTSVVGLASALAFTFDADAELRYAQRSGLELLPTELRGKVIGGALWALFFLGNAATGLIAASESRSLYGLIAPLLALGNVLAAAALVAMIAAHRRAVTRS